MYCTNFKDNSKKDIDGNNINIGPSATIQKFRFAIEIHNPKI